MASEAQTCAIGILANRRNAQVMVLSFLRRGLLLNRRLLRRFAPRNDERLDFSVIARPALQAVAISRTNKVVRQQTRRQESRVLGGPGFRIKCGMTVQKVPTKSCAFMQNKANFRKSQMNVKSYNTMAYENKSNWTLGENKPNSNPIKANCRKSKIDAKCVLTKDYEEKCG